MSTPSEPRQPHDGPALEPIRVLRPRRTDALAELMREYREEIGSAQGGNEPRGYESSHPGKPPGGGQPFRPAAARTSALRASR
ncbi:hypothetical protein ACH4HG_33510 [Streptomyces coeruleorubidus]|uniref:hypothetical protein n=1 Tax=Streptomyces coeruleorubidus TaxID=116188 RepID=UPI0019B84AE8|nr:hypothetical protein GCM10010244_67170 [Streptomyces bellus]